MTRPAPTDVRLGLTMAGRSLRLTPAQHRRAAHVADAAGHADAGLRLPLRRRDPDRHRIRHLRRAGVLLLCAGFGSATTAVSVSHDMTGGIIDRFRSMDISGPAVLDGHVAASVVATCLDRRWSSGSRSSSGSGRTPARRRGWPRSVSCWPSSWPSPGWPRRSGCWPNAGGGRRFTFFVMFCRTRAARSSRSTRCPPGCTASPATSRSRPVIETVRALLLDQPVGDSAWLALTWCGGILIASIALAAVFFRRRIA